MQWRKTAYKFVLINNEYIFASRYDIKLFNETLHFNLI